MLPRRSSWLESTAIAAVVSIVAVLLREAFAPLWGMRFVFAFAFPAVVVAAWYGRLSAGILATTALALHGAYELDPAGSLRVNGIDDLAALLVFSVFGGVMSLIAERLHRETERANALATQAAAADAERAAILESMQDGFVVLNADWTFRYINAQGQRLLDADANSVMGRNVWELYPEAVGTPLEACYRRVLATGTSEQIEHYVRPLGKWFELHVFPAAGEAGGIAMLYHDVTEQKRLVAKLRESSSTLQAIVEGTAEYIFAKDRAGRYTMANRATLALVGKSLGEMLGKTDAELLGDPAQAARVMDNDARVMTSGRPETVEETLVLPAGTRTYLSTKSPRFDEQGNVIGLIGIATDITTRKNVEAALREAHDSLATEVVERTTELVELSHYLLRVTEEEKSRLAAELHDALGGTLTTLVLALARLKTQVTPTTPAIDAGFAQIQATVQEVVAMTRRIIRDLRPVALDALGLAVALREHVERWSTNTGVHVTLDMPSRIPEPDHEIGLVVFRVVQEALTNIAKHAHATTVEVRVVVEPEWLVLAIEDDGVGMAARAPRRADSHGLVGMRERAAGVGGALVVDRGRSGRGTVIQLRVPVMAPRSLSPASMG